VPRHCQREIIRRATERDAPAIASVHVNSWQWAYRGLLPDAYLDNLSVADRETMHADRLADEGETRTWNVERDGMVVGFASTRPSRELDALPEDAEVGAIYLLADVAGTGIGDGLLDAATRDVAARGYKRITLWVLETNTRARRFYEKRGWTPDGTTKTETFGGVEVVEMRYQRIVDDR